jgi:hypothetical protein
MSRNAKFYDRKYNNRPDYICYPKHSIFTSTTSEQAVKLRKLLNGNPKERIHISELLDNENEETGTDKLHIAFCKSEHLIPESYGYLQMEMKSARLFEFMWGGCTLRNFKKFTVKAGDTSSFYFNKPGKIWYLRHDDIVFVVESGSKKEVTTCDDKILIP